MWSYQITGLSEPDVDNLLSLESLPNFVFHSWNNKLSSNSVIQLPKMDGAILYHTEAKYKLRIKRVVEALTNPSTPK